MRKLILTLSVVALFVVACKKSDDNSPKTLIVGKWNRNSAMLYTDVNNTLTPSMFSEMNEDTGGDWMQFNSDGSYTANNGGGTYTLSGNTIIFTEALQNTLATIKTLNAHTLVFDLKYPVNGTEYVSEQTYSK